MTAIKNNGKREISIRDAVLIPLGWACEDSGLTPEFAYKTKNQATAPLRQEAANTIRNIRGNGAKDPRFAFNRFDWENRNLPLGFANHIGYSDVNPYEITRVVGEKTLEIREMESTEKEWKKDWQVGGFSGVLTNQHDQEWEIKTDESNSVFKIRLHSNGDWKDKHGRRYKLSVRPVKFHDYNF